MSALANHLSRLLNILPGERAMVALVVWVMALTSAGFTLGSTGVEALFFARYGVEYLPYMYMILGILTFFTSMGITALLGRVSRQKLYLFIPISIALLTIFAWLALFSKSLIIYPILWLGKEVINALVSLVVWGIAGLVCDTRQSKRLFPLFNAGRILGTVVGGLGTGLLVSVIGTQNLLLAWTALLLLAFILTRALLRDHLLPGQVRQPRRMHKQASLLQDVQRGFQFVRGSALMRWISLAAILFSVLYYSIALPFSQSITARFPAENTLAGFLGLFNGLSTGAAFLASVFFANRLYARIGIMNAILALPVIYLLGFGGLALSSTFTLIITFRFAQMLWLSGIADSAYQAMFNAVPSAHRDQVRAFISGVPEQAGTFIAGAILILGEQAFSPQQLAIIGLVAAAVTIFAIRKAGQAYYRTLVDTLRAGRPTLFEPEGRQGLQLDADALRLTLDGITNPDALIRRVSAEMLGKVELPAAVSALVNGLHDPDEEVRLAALKSLARPDAAGALLEIAAHLADPAPVVRARAVDTLSSLTAYPVGLRNLLKPLLEDADTSVRIRAAVAMAKLGDEENNRTLLRQLSMLGSVDERVAALDALVEIGDPQALILFSNELADEHAPAVVRRAAAAALGSCGKAAIPSLIAAFEVEDASVQAGVSYALGKIGEPALRPVVAALDNPLSEEPALRALEGLPAWKEPVPLREYAARRTESALHYDSLRGAIKPNGDDRLRLLDQSLEVRARRDAILAMRTLSLLNDRETMTTAVEHLQSRSPGQVANALETLESTRAAALIRPLFRLWEGGQPAKPGSMQEAIAGLANEEDAWLRACANYAGHSKDEAMETVGMLSILDRIIWLRRVPLLADLTPQDLQRVAAITTEREHVDGEVICRQGEPGDEMYVIISGEVRVVGGQDGQQAKEIARRAAGDVVGEVSIISGEPRMASLIAVGDVRMLCLDHLNFESLLRERPEVSMAIMRELCSRLKQRM